MCFYPLLGGLVAEVQGGGVPVHSDVGVPYRGSVVCALDQTASTEPGNTQLGEYRSSDIDDMTSLLVLVCLLV